MTPRVKVTQAELTRLSILHDVAPVKDGIATVLAVGTGKSFVVYEAGPEYHADVVNPARLGGAR